MIVYYNDLDTSTIYGTKAVGISEDIHQRMNKSFDKQMFWAKLFIGTVDKVRNDEQLVDIIHGSRNEVSKAPKIAYERVKLMGGYGIGDDGEFWGNRRLPKVGSEVICAFIGMQEEHPVMLGGIITKRDPDIIDANAAAGTNINHIFQNGKFLMSIHPDGKVVIENDDITIDISADGIVDIVCSGNFNVDAPEINLNNGSKGVAREDDTIVINATTAAAFFTYLGTLIPPYAGAPIAGKINSSSASVKAG